MTRETYKGRKLIARAGRGRNYGQTSSFVNGQLIGFSAGKSEAQVIAQLRRDVDAADKRPDAYGEYWRVLSFSTALPLPL